MAQITSLEAMEKIVNQTKGLSWDGWDVLHRSQNPTAWKFADGVLVKGKWFTQKRYTPTIEGWDIPNKFVR